ncbi:hypothetical protein [Lysinibacillus sphaericus]|uniref:hypothetical protein n=1 Tax=Lysinibacillus sphaericus TaxID=1421 RepID=UPI003CFF1692
MEINPSVASLVFRMTEYDCFKLLTGKCSLNLTIKEYEYYKENYRPLTSASSVEYCRNLYMNIIKNGITDNSIDVCKYSCGHNIFQNGQHRACILKRKNLNYLLVKRYSESNDICAYCVDMKREKPILGYFEYEEE